MTSDMKFERALRLVLKHEGGYVNDPHDRGGETKYGISKKSYPQLDIPNLTKEQATEIYARDFWLANSLDLIQDPTLAAKLFDIFVNVGSRQGVVLLQNALVKRGHKLAVDGIMGPATLAAANADPGVTLLSFVERVYCFYRTLNIPHVEKYVDGWIARLLDINTMEG